MSEMYLGELVRLVLYDLQACQVLFEGKDAEILSVPNKFPTKFISEVEMYENSADYFEFLYQTTG